MRVHHIVIRESRKTDKKFQAEIDGKKLVHFGAKGMSDYTLHKDDQRKERYIARHKPRQNWTITGFRTAGFYSKHILWNKKTLEESIEDLHLSFKTLKVELALSKKVS